MARVRGRDGGNTFLTRDFWRIGWLRLKPVLRILVDHLLNPILIPRPVCHFPKVYGQVY